MTVAEELKEIKEMLRKIIRDMAKIRETQKQMKEEMHVVKDDLKRFREFWKKEKAEIQNRLVKLEEEEIKRDLTERLMHFERMHDAIECNGASVNDIKLVWDLPSCSSGNKNSTSTTTMTTTTSNNGSNCAFQDYACDNNTSVQRQHQHQHHHQHHLQHEKRIELVQGGAGGNNNPPADANNHKSTVNIEYKKLSINEKNMILKDGRRLIKQFFGGGRTEL